MEEALDPRIASTIDERFRVDDLLGAGGMGLVYRGEDLTRHVPVAIKFLHHAFVGQPEIVKRFSREVEALSRLEDPNIVGVVASGVSGGVPYMVMDLLAGQPLSSLLGDEGALAPERAVAIAQQVLSGVAHAHARGILHRDLKPENILLLDGATGRDRVMILDFGLAKMIHGDGGGSALTTTGMTLGTPDYMAPEQARGTPSDERTDLYAVGVVLYEMVAGRRPFVAENPMAILRMHMDDPPPPLRTVAPQSEASRALEAAILRALAKDPADRFPNASEFAEALAHTPEGRALAGEVPSLGRARGRWLALGALALVGGGLGLTWLEIGEAGRARVRHTLQAALEKVTGPSETSATKQRPPPHAVAHAAPHPPPHHEPEHPAPHVVDAEALLAHGHAEARKGDRVAALHDYDAALTARPSLKSDPELVRDAVAALDDPTYDAALNLLRHRVGATAVDELRRQARASKSAKLRKRAASLAAELAKPRR